MVLGNINFHMTKKQSNLTVLLITVVGIVIGTILVSWVNKPNENKEDNNVTQTEQKLQKQSIDQNTLDIGENKEDIEYFKKNMFTDDDAEKMEGRILNQMEIYHNDK